MLFALSLWGLTALLPSARPFSFSTTAPTECNALTVDWTGGSSPFSLILSPLFGSPRNISIPATAYANGHGSFSFPLPLPASKQFVLTMSDATSFASGGSTPVLTTGSSHGSTCNTTDPGVNFSFELNSALQQCRPYIVNGYDGAIQPITIVGTVPGGTSFVLTPPVGPKSYTWNANVAAGTSIIFSLFDAQGRNGGTSDVKTVGITDDATCLNNQSPSSTASLPVSSPTSTGSTSTSPSAPNSGGGQTSIAAVAGTVIGALVFLAVTITLGLFFLRKRHDARLSNARHVGRNLDLTYDPRPPNTYPGSIPASPLHYIAPGAPYDSNPFVDARSPHSSTNLPPGSTYLPPNSPYQPPTPYQDSSHSQYQPSLHSQSRSFSDDPDPFNPYALNHPPLPGAVQPFNIHTSEDLGSMTSTQRKAAMAGASVYTPSRFIVHTDVEDELPHPNNEGVVELPPQYSERRGQPPAIHQNELGSSSGSPYHPPS